jgi:glycosyltransferase involved in cell wall biosynthesis
MGVLFLGKKPMKLGLLLPSAYMYEPLGAGKIFAPGQLFLDLGNELLRRGHRVILYSSTTLETQTDVIYGATSLIVSEPYAMKMRYVSEKSRALISRSRARWEHELDLTARAYADARMGKVDLIHSFLEFSAHYFCEATGVPSIYTVHDPLPDKKFLDYWRLQRFPNDRYVAISKSQATLLGQVVKVVGTVYNGIQPERFQFSPDMGEYLLFIGRFMPEKGVEDALLAAKEAGLPIILAGSKEYREVAYYKEHIEPYLSGQTVHEVGYMDGKRKAGLYSGTKALLFPIHWEEPFGMVMVEAMACGTPVIAYNRGSVPEIVRDGITGFIIDENDDDRSGKGSWVIKKQGVEGLIEAVRRIGEIDRTACRRHVEENFTVTRMAEGYEQIYNQVISS